MYVMVSLKLTFSSATANNWLQISTFSQRKCIIRHSVAEVYPHGSGGGFVAGGSSRSASIAQSSRNHPAIIPRAALIVCYSVVK